MCLRIVYENLILKSEAIVVSVVSVLFVAVELSARHGNGAGLPLCSCRGAFQVNFFRDSMSGKRPVTMPRSGRSVLS